MSNATPPIPPAPPASTSSKRRNWFLRHKILTGIGALGVLIVVIVAAATGGGGSNKQAADAIPSISAPTSASSSAPPATTAPVTATTTAPASHASEPSLTPAQQQAVGSAKDYLAMEGFSRLGLIQQLSSAAGDGYKQSDAVIAVDSLHVDWNAEAVRSAKSYLQMEHFSCSGLVDQLSSEAGDQYTVAQARYGAAQAGIC